MRYSIGSLTLSFDENWGSTIMFKLQCRILYTICMFLQCTKLHVHLVGSVSSANEGSGVPSVGSGVWGVTGFGVGSGVSNSVGFSVGSGVSNSVGSGVGSCVTGFGVGSAVVGFGVGLLVG